MAKLFANSGDPDPTPHSAASDMGLHCLPITLLGSPNYNGLMQNHLSYKICRKKGVFFNKRFKKIKYLHFSP